MTNGTDGDGLVLVETDDGGITTVTLNRPEAMNALSVGLRRELVEVFRRLARDPGTEVVILTGRGRAFTAGLDLKEMAADAGSALGGEAGGDLDVSAALAAFEPPVIGAINGYAVTGGFEIALMCDVLVCSTEARFADTHARVGLVPGWGLSQRLPRLIGIMRAKELSLTGNFLDAETAYAWGMVNRVVAPEELLPTARRLARDMAETDRAVRAEILRLQDAGWETTLAEGLGRERRAARDFNTRVSREQLAGRREAVQRRGRTESRRRE